MVSVFQQDFQGGKKKKQACACLCARACAHARAHTHAYTQSGAQKGISGNQNTHIDHILAHAGLLSTLILMGLEMLAMLLLKSQSGWR